MKSASAILQSVEIRTNAWGLRGGEVPPPTPGKRRILFLGSSVTLGWGVPEAATVTERLRLMFLADGQDVEILNGGIGNYNIAAALAAEAVVKSQFRIHPERWRALFVERAQPRTI